ncbi:squalene--hopene cyclase [Pseudofrankia sp. BMG5.36]|uniref:squalene--hopene cyclase n=1 Tax=Pseudofrankia sp. BMG5.36 TaxID=1834512 RepID=UPI0008DA9711|nr:squalene--hopene cyclase [Pseudofrankia sp. BMG5.36]OHV73423.1 squalene-hopene cyclase [Pseudofrankia sp. BMG5.36]
MTTTNETTLAAGSPTTAFAPAPRGAADDDLAAGLTAGGVSAATATVSATTSAISATTTAVPRARTAPARLRPPAGTPASAAPTTAAPTLAAVPAPAATASRAAPVARPAASALVVPTVAPAGAEIHGDVLDDMLDRAVTQLRSLQDDAGWWKGDLESNTSIDAEDLMLRKWLGLWNQEQAELTARFIRSRQNADGSWPIYHAGPGDLAPTVESYVALRLVGDSPDAPHMRAAAAWTRAHGGVPAARIFTRIWLALFGWWRWEDLPVLPPELMLLPAKVPLSIYKFASWGRQTIVAITVLMARRPTGTPPFPIDELFPAPAPSTKSRRRGRAAGAWVDTTIDGLFHVGDGDVDGNGSLAAHPPAGGAPAARLATPAAPVDAPKRRSGRDAAPEPPDVAGRAKDGGGPGVPLPGGLLRRTGTRAARGLKSAALEHLPWDWMFHRVDRALHIYHRHPVRPLRALALGIAERWIVVRQEADGCFGGIQPPTAYSIIALRVLGYPMDHPVITAALRSLDLYSVTRPDGSRMQESCQSPVWDTCLATIALADAGLATNDPALVRAADWLVGQEVTARRGDWSVPIPDVPVGGWAFEFENDTYPDVDDSAEVMLALMRVAHPRPEKVMAATYRGLQWVFGMQCADGGWGAFDVDNAGHLVYKIPFADFGMLTDPPSADVTAHVVELLGELGLGDDPRTKRGVEWLLHSQEVDGSWYGRWGVNHIYGTGGVVPALRAAGLPASHPAIQRAADWLVSRQNPDGGWGEDCYSYNDMSTAGMGVSTASQTAWALLALIAAGRVGDGAKGEAAARGVAWLAATQTDEGSWDEDYYTGTGFAGYFYINYNLYRLVWPVMALGRYRRALAGDAH